MRRVIIDVDVGTDDFMAILILLYAEKLGLVHVEAITCTYGNTCIESVCKNVVRLLQILRKTDIPVYKGAHQPLILRKEKLLFFHGEDGFGDLKYDSDPDLSVIGKEPAAKSLSDIITDNPKEISLICLGPLTNLAIAVKLYENIAANLQDLWIMGGNYSGDENSAKAVPEFNFSCDPEAAYIVFECINCPIYVLPWETCLKPTITFDWRYTVLGCQTPAMQLLNKAEKSIYPDDEKLWLPCDAFVAFAYLHPEKYITKLSSHNAQIELRFPESRGLLLINNDLDTRRNIKIIEEIHQEKFQEFVLKLSLELI